MKDVKVYEIDLRDLFGAMLKNWIWLVIIPVLCAIGTFLYYRQQPDEYTASARLYVLLNYTDDQGQLRYDTSASTQFTGDFQELIKTEPVYQETADRLGSSIDVLKSVKIDVSEVSGTRVIIVSATSASPSLSLNVANTISQVFVEFITNLMKKDAVSIAAQATLPEGPSGPARVSKTIQVALISLLLVIVAMCAIRVLNTKLTNIDEIENFLKVPVLAGIPDYQDDMARFMKESKPEQTLGDVVSGATMEGVRTLATNIQFAYNKDMAGTTIMVTSTLTVEGKSTMSLLLSEALAEDGLSVLVCDFDVKRPSLGRYIGTRNRVDIIDYLAGKASLSQIATKTQKQGIYFVDFNHHNYSISQIVKHPGFNTFLTESRQFFNVILFDTCPLGMFIDAAVLSTIANGTLMVVGSGMVERHQAMEVIDQLKKANANILGVALNYIHPERGAKYYYYSKYGYGYGQRRSGESGKRKTEKAPEESVTKATQM
jgi:polysaccharide biosynthesis transport protein